jgi:hypothetical protein
VCYASFRFTRRQLQRLVPLLLLDGDFTFSNRAKYSGETILLAGAYRGRVHDSIALRHSGLNRMLQQLSETAGEHCDIYGDSAYPISSNIAKAFGSRQIQRIIMCTSFLLKHYTGASGIESSENQCRMGLHECHAWLGRDQLASIWACFLNKPGKKFKTAVLLTNIRCCFQGNLISHFFACRPSTPESYLSIWNLWRFSLACAHFYAVNVIDFTIHNCTTSYSCQKCRT